MGAACLGRVPGRPRGLLGVGLAQSGSFSPCAVLKASSVSCIPRMRLREVERLPCVTQLGSEELASPQLAHHQT